MKRAAELVDDYVGETLTYYASPDSHWIKLKTNNPLERLTRGSGELSRPRLKHFVDIVLEGLVAGVGFEPTTFRL